MVHYPPLSRIADEQPRLDGSIHVPHACYECGATCPGVQLHSIVSWNRDTHEVDYLWACADLTECMERRAAVTA